MARDNLNLSELDEIDRRIVRILVDDDFGIHSARLVYKVATGESEAREEVVIPLIGAKDEDDGYLVSFIIDENTGRSECVLIDCKRFADGPVCRIALPHKISSGTHAVWADRAFIRDGFVAA